MIRAAAIEKELEQVNEPAVNINFSVHNENFPTEISFTFSFSLSRKKRKIIFITKKNTVN